MKRLISLLLAIAIVVTSLLPSGRIYATDNAKLTIHYQRTDGVYDDWNIWAWDTGTEDMEQIDFTAKDDFGTFGFSYIDNALPCLSISTTP